MEIRAGAKYPASKLTNFAPNKFVFDGVECYMEGFLQSLKFKNPDMQRHICSLYGLKAKRAGSKKDWRKKQLLWWQGKAYKRSSREYQELLDRVYLALAKQNSGFCRALLATGNATLKHSLGRKKKKDTVLTRKEFTSRLHWLRGLIKKGEV